MSVRVIEQVWKTSHQHGRPLLVLLALADFADDDGIAFPSVETLAKKVRIDERSVHRIVADLVTDQELRVERTPGRVNVYKVLTNGVTPEPPLTKQPPPPVSPLTPEPPGGDTGATPPLTPGPPKPSINRHRTVNGSVQPKIEETLCPTGPHTFTGSYADHLENDPRHKVKARA